MIKYFIQKLMETNQVHLDKKYCLRHQNQTQGCNVCRENCPKDAITLVKGAMEIDDELCIGCGICKSTCPSQAITIKGFGELKALKSLNQKDILVVSCGNHGEGEGNILFPCLNGLHKEYLVTLLLVLEGREIYFNLSKCKDCTIEKKSQYFLAELECAKASAEFLGVKSVIRLIQDKEHLPQYKQESISRRELFAFLKEESIHTTKEMTNGFMGKNNTVDFNQRKILQEILEERACLKERRIPKEISPFTSWEVNSKCKACGFCQAVCPWRAWDINKGENKITMKHHGGKCRSCNLCQELCPQRALEKGDFPLMNLSEAIEKAKTPLMNCRKCAKKYAVTAGDEGLCETCKKRENVKKSLLGRKKKE